MNMAKKKKTEREKIYVVLSCGRKWINTSVPNAGQKYEWNLPLWLRQVAEYGLQKRLSPDGKP